jgi:two-component system response regulator AtoC
MAHVLVVDDEPQITSKVCGVVEDLGHQVMTTTRPVEAMSLLDKHSFDLVITDLSMPEVTGMEILKKAISVEGTQVIIMTAFATVANAVEAMKLGAIDYIEKPFSLDVIEFRVKKVLELQKQKSLVEHYEKAVSEKTNSEFVGLSPAAQKVKDLINKVATSDATVLLTGRSGTGKELAAKMIHNQSSRENGPFIAVNCAALPESLLESELFGHEKGSFTGADSRKRGRFELADSGTLFLDEIGEMSVNVQTKLLRVLEERMLIRVGGVDQIEVDVRVISATNRELKKEIEQGRFREDLYFRLNVFPIELPNLSDRKEDIVPLAEHFLKRLHFSHTTLDKKVSALLQSYDWPGNIRELRNVLERAAILSGGEPLTIEEFSLEVDNEPIVDSDKMGTNVEGGLVLAEKQMIIDALEKCKGNKTEAARMLKISRRRLYSRMKIHGISP